MALCYTLKDLYLQYCKVISLQLIKINGKKNNFTYIIAFTIYNNLLMYVIS